MNRLAALETSLSSLLLWVVLAPLVGLVVQTARQPEWQLLWSAEGRPVREALGNSLTVSLLTAALSVTIGACFAFVVARREFVGRGLMSSLPLAPLTLPPLVGVMSFLFLFGDVGLLQGMLATLRPDLVLPTWNGLGPVLLVHVYSFFPLAYLLLRPAVGSLSAELDGAASTLGASRFDQLRHVWLPQLAPALTGAAWLSFMGSMASFSAPYLLGGTTRFLSTEIVARRLGGEATLAAIETILLAGIGLCLLAFRPRAQAPLKGQRSSQATSRGLTTLTAVAAAGLLLPHATLLLLSFIRDGSWTWQPLPTEYTWANHLRLASEPAAWESLRNSAMMALGATAIGAAWALAVARAEVMGPTRGRGVAALAGAAAWAIPATALALAWLEAYNRPTLAGLGLSLTATPWLLPWAYTLRFLPLQSRAVVAALNDRAAGLERVAWTLGARPWVAARTVGWPLVRGPLLAASALVFVLATGEFVVSILLYVPENRPVSLEILSHLRLFHFGRAAALGSWLSLLLALVLFLVSQGNARWPHRWRSWR